MSSIDRTQAKAAGAKARRVFWVLVAIAILAMGSLTSALTRPPGMWTGLTSPCRVWCCCSRQPWRAA